MKGREIGALTITYFLLICNICFIDTNNYYKKFYLTSLKESFGFIKMFPIILIE
jgi:hypothetical protein